MPKVNLVKVKEMRKDRSLSLKDMASELGYKNASVYLKYERGEYQFKANHLPILAKALGCNIADFFEN